EGAREGREHQHDHEDQPDVVGLPDGRDGLVQRAPLFGLARAASQQIPDPGAQIRAARERVQHQAQAEREPAHCYPEAHSAAAPSAACAGELRVAGSLLTTWRKSSTATTLPSSRYSAMLANRLYCKPGIGVTASRTRITPWMIHGWRPTSVTAQPASTAIRPSGEASTAARRKLRSLSSARRRHKR